MKELRKETKVVMIKAMCECGGEFKRMVDVALLSNPAKHKHICDKCGKVEEFHRTYPYTQVEGN